jgi:hypothetical protein
MHCSNNNDFYWSNGNNFSGTDVPYTGKTQINSHENYGTWNEVDVGPTEEGTLYSFRDELDAGPGIFHNIEDAWFKSEPNKFRHVAPNTTEITDGGTTWTKEEVDSEQKNGRELLSTNWENGSGRWSSGSTYRHYATRSHQTIFLKYERAALDENESVVTGESLSYDRFSKLAGII